MPHNRAGEQHTGGDGRETGQLLSQENKMSCDSKGQGRRKFPEAPDEILCRWCAESLHLTCKLIGHGQPLAGQARHGLGTLDFHIETSSPVFEVA